jgi:hypothetical protein
VAAGRSDTSLLLRVKKQKKHRDGQSQDDSGLTECTIVQPGGGGGCKTGFKYVCEKLKSGNKCCGCVPHNGSQATGNGSAQDQVDTQNKADGRFGVDFDTVPPAQTTPQQAPAQGGAGKTDSGGIKPIDETPADTLLLPYCEEKDGKLVCPTQH